MLTAESIEQLAAAAVAAPSADNQHVFRLRVDGDSLAIHAAGDLLSAPTTRRMLGLISVGTAAENMMLRGKRLGLRLEPQWWPADHDHSLIARFACRPADPVQDPLEQAIERRHTNRRLRFEGPPLDAAAQEQLSNEAKAIEGARLVWLDRPALRSKALHLIRLAEAERFSNEELHRELFDSIRFDAGWNESTEQGLPPGALGLPLFERGSFSMMRSWRVQQFANLLGAHRFIGFRAADLPCRLAPHLCAISAAGDIEPAALSAGRLLERVWLRATVLGLACQVFAASPLYALKGATAIGVDLQRRLAEGWGELCADRRPYIVIRMGRAQPPEVRAGRPAPMSVVAAV